MDKYKDLIDLALDTGDKEWFNHLTQKLKSYEEFNIIDNTNQNKYKNITLEEFNNNSVVLQTEKGLKTPYSCEELEKYKFVKIKSKRINALKILKDEEVIIESLSTEENFYYKTFYNGFFQGFSSGYKMKTEKTESNEYLKLEIQIQKAQINMLLKDIEEKDKKLSKITSNKNKPNLLNRLKELLQHV